MDNRLARRWWLIVLRGVLAILFGAVAFVWPEATILALVWMFGVYALVDGLVSVGAGLSRTSTSSRWWALILEGLVSIATAVIALIWPDVAALALVLLIGSWAVITGVLEIAAAIRLRDEISNEWLLALGGLVSIGFGVVLFIWPGAAGVAIIWTVAAYAIIFGVLLIALGFRLRRQAFSAGGHPARAA